MGGVGSLNYTGLGAFLGAGADPVFDPLLVQGLQASAQAISHVAIDPPGTPPPPAKEMSFSSPGNLECWADWVRASLYLSDFMQSLEWRTDKRARSIMIGFEGQEFFRLRRPSITTFQEQLKIVRSYADQRVDRTAEILTQLGFPTPYFMMILGLQTAPNRHTLELITVTQVLSAHVCMIAKHHMACRRPDRLGASVMPIIPTPAHGSFPSAHATEAFAVAEVLNFMIGKQKPAHYPDPGKRQRLISKLAERIAVHRTVAGLHFPIDSWAGAILGRAVGQLILARSGASGGADAYRYEARGNLDFFLAEFSKGANRPFGVHRTGSCEARRSDLFEWLWMKASKEFDLAR